MGFRASRPATTFATRSMASALSTEVPPNFITSMRTNSGSGRSIQVTLVLEQLRIQKRGAGGATNRVVREHGELPVQQAARTQTPDYGAHAVTAIHIQSRLRTVVAPVIHDRLLGRRGQLQILR